ncbi:LacI family DNA-binding transcriptional regulator [Microbacterium resistens]|nr:LacI family DNA-binding transcriptional regulator [Microbacterium resistens]
MATVAARAGVSGQTVSRVVNDSPHVDPETRARVEEAMAELGYRPHRAARALRTGRSHTIGVIAQTLATVGNSRMLQAVAEAAEARGYALTVVTLGESGWIDDAVDRLRDQGVDGAIVLNEASALTAGAAVDGLALAVVDAPSGGGFGVVGTDHAEGARTATAYLLARGHATVHHLAGPQGSVAADAREQGWRAALLASGAPTPRPVRGDWSARSGFVRTVELLRGARDGAPEVTAIFAANDQMALGALRALAEAGRRVPEDVAVIGFDDVADAADYRPPLTTVRQDFDALGGLAVRLVVERAEGTVPADPPLLRPQLVVRVSA